MTKPSERVDDINESLRLIQRTDGLQFGTDSYLLAAFVRAVPNGRAAELGGGTGVVSLLCAARAKFKKILCAELQPDYADLIRRNIALNGLSDRIEAWEGDIRALTAEEAGRGVRVVFSNPPYLRAGCGKTSDSDGKNAARREENGDIGDFARCASRLLGSGGVFSVVYRPDRLAGLFSALRDAGLEPKRMTLVYPSAADKPCLVLVEAKKDAGEGLVLSRPLIIYADKEKGVYTDDMREVYDRFSLAHLT